jgi:hypothetical protein
MNKQRISALLGRRDEPTDGVEEYCAYLREHSRAAHLKYFSWEAIAARYVVVLRGDR